jgi:hypothetical protein
MKERVEGADSPNSLESIDFRRPRVSRLILHALYSVHWRHLKILRSVCHTWSIRDLVARAALSKNLGKKDWTLRLSQFILLKIRRIPKARSY